MNSNREVCACLSFFSVVTHAKQLTTMPFTSYTKRNLPMFCSPIDGAYGFFLLFFSGEIEAIKKICSTRNGRTYELLLKFSGRILLLYAVDIYMHSVVKL